MVAVTLYDRGGYLLDEQWYCDACAADVLTQAVGLTVEALREQRKATRDLPGRAREEFVYYADTERVYCFGSCDQAIAI